MFRFTIRDLFWVMFLVGFSLWSLNYRRQILAVQRTYQQQAREEVQKRELAELRAAEAEERVERIVQNAKTLVRLLKTDMQRLEAPTPPTATPPAKSPK